MVVLSIVAGVCPITRHARGVFAAPFQGSQPNASTFRVAMTVETAGRILVTTQPSFAEAINWIQPAPAVVRHTADEFRCTVLCGCIFPELGCIDRKSVV